EARDRELGSIRCALGGGIGAWSDEGERLPVGTLKGQGSEIAAGRRPGGGVWTAADARFNGRDLAEMDFIQSSQWQYYCRVSNRQSVVAGRKPRDGELAVAACCRALHHARIV